MSMNLNTKSQITEFVSASPQPQDVVSNRIPANGRSRRSLLSQNLPSLSEGSSQEATVLMQLTTDKNTSRSLTPEQVKDHLIDWVKESANKTREVDVGLHFGKTAILTYNEVTKKLTAMPPSPHDMDKILERVYTKYVLKDHVIGWVKMTTKKTREVEVDLPFTNKVFLTYDEATTELTVKKQSMSEQMDGEEKKYPVTKQEHPQVLACVYNTYIRPLQKVIAWVKESGTEKRNGKGYVWTRVVEVNLPFAKEVLYRYYEDREKLTHAPVPNPNGERTPFTPNQSEQIWERTLLKKEAEKKHLAEQAEKKRLAEEAERLRKETEVQNAEAELKQAQDDLDMSNTQYQTKDKEPQPDVVSSAEYQQELQNLKKIVKQQKAIVQVKQKHLETLQNAVKRENDAMKK